MPNDDSDEDFWKVVAPPLPEMPQPANLSMHVVSKVGVSTLMAGAETLPARLSEAVYDAAQKWKLQPAQLVKDESRMSWLVTANRLLSNSEPTAADEANSPMYCLGCKLWLRDVHSLLKHRLNRNECIAHAARNRQIELRKLTMQHQVCALWALDAPTVRSLNSAIHDSTDYSSMCPRCLEVFWGRHRLNWHVIRECMGSKHSEPQFKDFKVSTLEDITELRRHFLMTKWIRVVFFLCTRQRR